MSVVYGTLSVPLAETLARCRAGDRVLLCGPYLPASAYREWLSDCGDWQPRISKARSSGACEASYTRGSDRVRVTSAATWFGDEPLSPEQVRRRLNELVASLNRAFKREGRLPLVSPAVTGLTLWREMAEETYPPLSEEHQTLIRSTCGQGREEVLCPNHTETIPGFCYLDMRLAYGAFAENLPVGPAVRDTGSDVPAVGRVRVRFVIPRGWAHVGLLPAKAARRRLTDFSPAFPAQPGAAWEAWVDAREARLALQAGWEVRVLERLVMTEGKPLNTWARRLIALYERAAVPALARAYRAILLQSIGDLHGRGRTTERLLRFPGGGESVMPLPQARRAERLSHPEWTAAIWARCRYRLAAHMLTVPRETLLGCCVDAAYLTTNPGWAETGKPGGWRLKGALAGPLPAPKTLNDLHALSDQAREEDGHAVGG
jgi:hypothetical protein